MFRNPIHWVFAVVVLWLGCGTASTPQGTHLPPTHNLERVAVAADRAPDTVEVPVLSKAPVLAGDPVTVVLEDSTRGPNDAPITIVEFGDLECPFTQKAHKTLRQLVRDNASNVRWVFKHHPLAFHANARRAAEIAASFQALRGDEAAFAFIDAVLAESLPAAEERPAFYERIAQGTAAQFRLSIDLLADGIKTHGRERVNADVALADVLGSRGTPDFFVNGTVLTGAQPLAKFQAMIDAELPLARLELERGTPRSSIYAARVAHNFPQNAPRSTKAEDLTVWRVPLGQSPIQGSPNAPVTIVAFTDYECRFCQRVQSTLAQIAARYPEQVRFVHKNAPLAHHALALPAAHFASEVFARKGNKAFWQVHDALFRNQESLGNELFGRLSEEVGLTSKATLAAVEKQQHRNAITADLDLASDLDATATPSFFINGRRLVGNQPLDKFSKLIDAELEKAKTLMQAGTPASKVYETIMREAKDASPVRKKLPAPTKANPSKGTGPVLIEVFTDFECPFCGRLQSTLAELEREMGTQLRIVHRNLPLAMHKEARRAATAALEVKKQLGDEAFWKYHDALFRRQKELAVAIEEEAVKLGVDQQKFTEALASGAHEATIAKDEKIAKDAGISGTPTAVVGGIVVNGALPLATFKRAVTRATRKTR